MIKIKKIMFMVFSLICFISIGVCIIVNMTITGYITWAKFPLIAIPFGWIVISSLFAKKHQVIFVLIALTVLTFPFLYLLEKETLVDGWFLSLGIPLSIVGITWLWLVYLLFRFAKVSPWYKSAIAVFLLGVIASPIISHYIDTFSGAKLLQLNTFINIFFGIIIAAALAIIGHVRISVKHIAEK